MRKRLHSQSKLKLWLTTTCSTNNKRNQGQKTHSLKVNTQLWSSVFVLSSGQGDCYCCCLVFRHIQTNICGTKAAEKPFAFHDNLPFCSFSRDVHLIFHWAHHQQLQYSNNQYLVIQASIQVSTHVSSTEVEGIYLNTWAASHVQDHKVPDKA